MDNRDYSSQNRTQQQQRSGRYSTDWSLSGHPEQSDFDRSREQRGGRYDTRQQGNGGYGQESWNDESPSRSYGGSGQGNYGAQQGSYGSQQGYASQQGGYGQQQGNYGQQQGNYGQQYEESNGRRSNQGGYAEQQRYDSRDTFRDSYRSGGEYGMGSSTMRRGKAPKNFKRSDDRINEDVCERLMSQGLDCSGIEVSCKDGVVTLSGEVCERADKHAMEQIAADTSGVKDVDNQMRLRRGESDSSSSKSGQSSNHNSGQSSSQNQQGQGAGKK